MIQLFAPNSFGFSGTKKQYRSKFDVNRKLRSWNMTSLHLFSLGFQTVHSSCFELLLWKFQSKELHQNSCTYQVMLCFDKLLFLNWTLGQLVNKRNQYELIQSNPCISQCNMTSHSLSDCLVVGLFTSFDNIGAWILSSPSHPNQPSRIRRTARLMGMAFAAR